jgi:predicted acylesterase/phospholipase RssA
MNVQFQPNFRTAERRLPFECVALVLQGGGALGAYQAGVYEALTEANINPDWVAGVSIGAINSAIIAGNETSERVAKLRTFWQEITANPLLDWAAAAHTFAPKGTLHARSSISLAQAARSQRVLRAFSRFGSLPPGCTRTAPRRPRAFTKPKS